MPTFAFEDISPEDSCLFSWTEEAGMGDAEGEDEEGQDGKEFIGNTMVVYVIRGTEIVSVMYVLEEGKAAFMSGGGSRLGIADTSSSDLS